MTSRLEVVLLLSSLAVAPPACSFSDSSHTITSTIYWPRDDDSTFLFFTDENVIMRPILGALNLATGVTAGAVGALAAPFDGGRRLTAGLRGALFSLPELAFANIRKGSFDYIAPLHRPVALR